VSVGGAFFQFKLERGLEVTMEDEVRPAEARLNELGRDGWSVVATSGGYLVLQRVVVAEDALEAEAPKSRPPGPPPEMVEPRCGCGCGEDVSVTVEQFKEADAKGLSWFLEGHHPEPGVVLGKAFRRR
jgi:hypothetical protein